MYFHRRRLLGSIMQEVEPNIYINDINVDLVAYISYLPEQLRRLNGCIYLSIPDHDVYVNLYDFNIEYPTNGNPDWAYCEAIYHLTTNQFIPNNAECNIIVKLDDLGDGIAFYDGTIIWADYNKRKEIRTFTHPLGSGAFNKQISYTCTFGELLSNGIHVQGGARYSLNMIGLGFKTESIDEEEYTGGPIHTRTVLYMIPKRTYSGPYKNLLLTIKYAYYDNYGDVKQGQHKMIVNTSQLVAGNEIEIPELSSHYLGYTLVSQQNFWSCTYDKQVPQYTSKKVNGQTVYTPVTVTDTNNVDENIFVYFAGFDGELSDSSADGGYGYY